MGYLKCRYRPLITKRSEVDRLKRFSFVYNKFNKNKKH